MIIKQEPGEVTTQQSTQLQVSSAGATQQQQYVTVKGGHMIAMSPQKSGAGSGGSATPSKVTTSFIYTGSVHQSTTELNEIGLPLNTVSSVLEPATVREKSQNRLVIRLLHFHF